MNWHADKPGPAATALQGVLRTLEEAFTQLLLALEDHPPKAVPALLDHFENAATDRLGELSEIRASANGVATVQTTFEQRLSCLANAQEKSNLLARNYRQELAAFDRVRSLQRLGRERGGEWTGWAHAVRLAIESCAVPLDALQGALLGCWREQSTRGGVVFVGQPVVLPEVTFTLGKEQPRNHP